MALLAQIPHPFISSSALLTGLPIHVLVCLSVSLCPCALFLFFQILKANNDENSLAKNGFPSSSCLEVFFSQTSLPVQDRNKQATMGSAIGQGNRSNATCTHVSHLWPCDHFLSQGSRPSSHHNAADRISSQSRSVKFPRSKPPLLGGSPPLKEGEPHQTVTWTGRVSVTLRDVF